MSDRVLVMREGTIVGELHHDRATEENVMSYAAGVGAYGGVFGSVHLV